MDYIEVGGEKRPFRLSYKAIKELKAEQKKNPEIVHDETAYAEFQIFLGFKHGALKEGQEIDFKLSDMEDWIDEDMSIMSQYTDIVSKNHPEETGKKKGG